MNPKPDLRAVAKKVVWFKTADKTLDDEVFFLNHAMTFGDVSDVLLIRKHYDDDALRNALRNAHPGIFDPRSWTYWHLVLGISPTPAMPTRKIPGAESTARFRDGLSIRGHQ
ncbi:MAG: hypothetical protein OXF43_10700 [Gammaproteobacteria bacterium]|nr:hypothetical protein [Gammaproteobacteria bacterium]